MNPVKKKFDQTKKILYLYGINNKIKRNNNHFRG